MRGCIAALAVGLAVIPSVGSPASAADRLALTRTDVPGFKAAGDGATVARSALGRRAPAELRARRPQGAAFRASGKRLLVGVFPTRSKATAARALRKAGRGFARLGGIGDAALRRSTTSRRRAEATVLLRSGRFVGAVALRLGGRTKAARQLARAGAAGFAGALATRIERLVGRTAWDRVLDGIRADGSVPPKVALRAFAISHGPLPGVRRPRGPRGRVWEGTLAIEMVDEVWERLTPAQRAAIDRALGARHDPSSPPLARTAVANTEEDYGTLTEDIALTVLAKTYVPYFDAHLTSPLPAEIRVFRASKDWGDLAETVTIDDEGYWGFGAEKYCRIVIAPKGMSYKATKAFDYLLAHEVFHCFQRPMHDGPRPKWITEGLADWAALQATKFDGPEFTHYRKYLDTPSTSLFERSYDALGFWGHVEEIHGAPFLWERIPSITFETNGFKQYLLAGATDPAFATTWASAPWRFTNGTTEWKQLKPYWISSSDKPLHAKTIVTSSFVSAPHYALGEGRVYGNGDLPLVQIQVNNGTARAGTDQEDLGMVAPGQDWFCFAGKCECPAGSTSTVPE